MSAFNPIGAHVEVRLVDPQAVSKGGIVIPDTARKRPLEGVVLAVGRGWYDDFGKLHPIGVEVGERVMFSKFGPTELETDKDVVLHRDHILAVIGKDGESIRAFDDNVILRMAPAPQLSEVILLQDRKAKTRNAKVLVSGPGYVTRLGAFVENEVKEGQEVKVNALCGQNYDLDLTVPRQNKGAEFDRLFNFDGEFRIVRCEEIMGVIERTDEADKA